MERFNEHEINRQDEHEINRNTEHKTNRQETEEKAQNNEKTAGKPASKSELVMTQLVLPNDTNNLGNLLGGRLMHWIDIAGALAASRHSSKNVVTVALDSLDFRHPVHMGEMVTLKAKLTWTGRTSMEVVVKVYAENLKTGSVRMTNKAYLTFVAVDDDGKPTPVPPVIPETEEELKEYAEAEIRRNERLRRRAKSGG